MMTPEQGILREGPVHVAGQEIAPGSCGLAESIADVKFSSSTLSLLAAPCA